MVLTGWVTGVRIPAGAGIALGPTQRPVREGDHSPPSSAEVMA